MTSQLSPPLLGKYIAKNHFPGRYNFYYEYTRKDHLGNSRANFRANGSSITFLEESHYYAFGMRMEGLSTASPDNKYLYNGKELETEYGLDWYAYGFRYYDPVVGRFTSIDPALEKYPEITPFAYVANNPILNIDPRGDTLRAVNETSGVRALNIIQNTFHEMGLPGYQMANLFALNSDGKTFSNINGDQFTSALSNLSSEGQALAIGYYLSIMGEETNVVEAVTRSETISEYGQESIRVQTKNSKIKTGLDVDNKFAGGFTGQAHHQNGIVNIGGEGSYAILVLDSKAKISYNDRKTSSLPGELLAHELLGHGLGGRSGNSVDSSIQMTNAYLKSTGKIYYRKDHSVTDHSRGFNPHATPRFRTSAFGF